MLKLKANQALQLTIAGCQRRIVGRKRPVGATHGFKHGRIAEAFQNTPAKISGGRFFDG
ncbi:hypothetical protein LP415_08265 [Polaromonas sp. P1(28)-8]|nr:hypothetical protein LP415_08265 [Polaromonas sp. P1(28)-8]